MGFFQKDDYEWEDFEEDDFSPFKALVGLVKFVVFIGVSIYLVYKYWDQLKQKLDELRSRYSFLDKAAKKLEASIKEMEVSSKDKIEEVEAAIAEVKDEVEKKGNEVSSYAKSVAKDSFRLNKRQEAIYNLIQDAGEVTMAEIADVIAGVTNRTLRRDTTKLEKLGLIVRKGRTKNSVYRLRH